MTYWDLSTIYKSFDSAAFQNDITTLKALMNDLDDLTLTADFATSARQYIEKMSAVLKLIYPLYIYSHLVFSVDSNNQSAIKYLDALGMMRAQLAGPAVKFQKWVAGFDANTIETLSDNLLVDHQFFLRELQQNAQYLLSEKEEVLLTKLRWVGAHAWGDLMSKLTGDLQAEIELDGKMQTLTLSMLRNLAAHDDGAVRKRAYQAELAAYPKIDASIAAALNGIKGDVNITAKMRGFDSPLAEAIHSARLDRATLDAMLSAMQDKLPVFRKYLKRKAKLLGHSAGLPFYDLFAPIGDGKAYSYDDAKQFVIENFASFSDQLRDHAVEAFANNWVDVEPRKGKRGGAFCAPVIGRNQSRVMLNFDGTFDGVRTLAHELGHAYHNRQLYDEHMLLADYPMPLAETASIFCETIVSNAAAAKADKGEAIFILEKSISVATQIIVDILSRFIFEKAVFEQRQNGPLSVDKLKELMLDAQAQSYGDGLDENYRHPYMWACKPHYYSVERNYYNFPYAFGMLFALGLYAEYQKGRPNFIADYDQLLKNTTRMNVKAVAAGMGIDIAQKDFWLSSLQIVERQIDQFIEMTN